MAENEKGWGLINIPSSGNVYKKEEYYKEGTPPIEDTLEEEEETVLEEDSEEDIEVEEEDVVDEEGLLEEGDLEEEEEEEAPKQKKEEDSKRESRSAKRIKELLEKTKKANEELEKERQERLKLEKQLKRTSRGSDLKEAQSRLETVEETIKAKQAALKYAEEEDEKTQILMDLTELKIDKKALDIFINNKKAELTDEDKDEVEEKPKKTQNKEQTVSQEDLPEATKSWLETNKDWFLSDKVLHVTARTLSDEMVGEGYDDTSEEFYQELNIRMHENFPSKFDKEGNYVVKSKRNTSKDGEGTGNKETEHTKAPNKTRQIVNSSGVRSNPTPKKGTRVTLSEEEREFAKRLGIPPERYALRKKQIEKASASSGYVEINVKR